MPTKRIRSRRSLASLALVVSWIVAPKTDAFQVGRSLSWQKSPPSKTSNTRLRSSSEDSSSKQQSTSEEATLQQAALSITLADLESLKDNVLEADDKEALEILQGSLQDAESRVAAQLSALLPPVDLSLEDYVAAIRVYAKLPIRSRIAFCEALSVENPVQTAGDWERIPEIVALLYSERPTTAALQQGLKKTKGLVVKERILAIASSVEEEESKENPTKQDFLSLFQASNQSREELALDATIDNMLPRVTRKDERVATEADLNTLMAVLGRDTFVVSEKVAIPGGFFLRGNANSKLTSESLLEAIDKSLPKKWSCQVSYLPDFTEGAEGGGEDDSPVLLLLRKDMSPSPSPWLLGASSLAAVGTAFLFSVGVYGGNDFVKSRLTEQSSIGDFVGVEWFSEKTLEVLLPLLAIQLFHEIGHWAIAQRDGLKTTTPILIPGWGLPFLGCLSNLKESPPNLSSLFDYALAGPVLGLAASLGCLVTGLELTNLASPEALHLLPALPVSVLQTSSLAGSLVDSMIGGGQGFITLQDPQTAVSLHPLAIAGFAGLFANALSLLPLGATDGGRLSLALLGRSGNLAAGGLTWLILLLASFTLERPDALIGAWVVYNLAQNDAEIPCRDEVTQVDTVRAVTAFGLWFVALLTVIPM
jgi:Zn-dependent protease